MAQYGRTAGDYVWKVANASKPQQYNELKAALKVISPTAHADLAKIPKEQLVRAFFPLPRYGHVTSNNAESTNAWLLECRKRSPMKLFLKAIQKINARFAGRWEIYDAQDEAAIVDKVFAEIVKNNENG